MRPISNIKLKSYGKPDGISFNPQGLTVFVGPNNSGKSGLLREIKRFCTEGTVKQSEWFLDSLQYTPADPALEEEEINAVRLPKENLNDAHTIFIGRLNERHQANIAVLKQALKNRHLNSQVFSSHYLKFRTSNISGENRSKFTNDQPLGDIQLRGQNSLAVLFRDDDKRKRVQDILFDAFGLYLVIEPTGSGSLRLRFSETIPNPSIERSLGDESIDFFKKAVLLTEFSDGVRAYVGIILEVLAGDPLVLVIDEPEAFLHPSLAFKLGNVLSKLAIEYGKQIFASTHSSSFVMGCIHAGIPANLVRLTYENKMGKARHFSSQELAKVLRNPLMRSVDAIQGLFYQYVVVTESDADRAFYQEINERILTYCPGEGISNCLFLNAHNKQTVHEIVYPLRRLGIPTLAVVDIDILKEGGSVWTDFLKSGGVPERQHQPMGQQRAQLFSAFKEAGLEMKSVGVAGLSSSDQESADNFFDGLEAYGLFAVRRGELERWLPDLGVLGRHGPAWLVSMFEKMGDDPLSLDYIKPKSEDVWSFVKSFSKWLKNPMRKGIPE